MKSEKVKVLHSIHGKPLLKYVIDLAYKVNPEKIYIVVGFKRGEVKKKFVSENVEFIDQKEQLGTGHAIMQMKPFFKNCSEEILVLSGDVPFLRESTINEMINAHRLHHAAVTILTVEKNDPTGYGRILRNCNNKIEKIVEENDCSNCEKAVQEINTGIYLFNKGFLLESLDEINQNNAQQEFYLTELVRIAFNNLLPIAAVKAKNLNEVKGINTKAELAEAEKLYLKN